MRPLLAFALLAGSAAGTLSGQSPAAGGRAEAERLRHEERFPEALAVYRALASSDSARFEDRFWIAKLESWTGALESAERDLTTLLAERPGDYDTRIALADVRRWRGDAAGARAVLDGLAAERPDDPEVRTRLAALRPEPGWEADLVYLGERFAGGAGGDGATMSLRPLPRSRTRWLAAVTIQDKFQRTEARAGGEIGMRLARNLEVSGSVFLAPGADVLPRQSYGAGLTHPLGGGVVLGAGYGFDRYADARVHGLGPSLELYLGRWLLAARYRYTATHVADAGTVGEHGGVAAVGRFYGDANLVRVFAAAGGEAFSLPSRERIGRLEARTVGVAWRHFVTRTLGLEAAYSRQDRGGAGVLHSYGLRVVRRW